MRCVFRTCHLLAVVFALTLVFNGTLAHAQDGADQPIPSETTDVTETAPDAPADESEKDDDGSPGLVANLLSDLSDYLGGKQKEIDDFFKKVNDFLGTYIFYNVLELVGDEEIDGKHTIGNLPFAVIWLVIGSIFFTLRMGFINVRAFKHAIFVTAGRFDNPDDKGEVTHFQALTSALSATVGLGNIAGVAIAISIGGPGATVWMIFAGFLGMTSKFVECTLGQKYREVRPDGKVMGGAMYYLSRGLKKMGLGPLGSVLGFMFAVLCIGGSFGGGCTFQVNQSLNAVAESVPFLKDHGWVFGVLMTVAVGVVIIGGIRSIARVAEKIVPAMCGVYCLSAMVILVMNAGLIPDAIGAILNGAFSSEAAYGGLIGVLVQGFKRAAFSNEAGVGSAAIAHAAAKTEYPVREGIVALLGPFIDTIVICTMTALVIVITGAYNNPDAAYELARTSNQGATLTSLAMDAQISGFRYVLAVAVTLFAYSTMISWSYYGERCCAYIFGDGSSMAYRIVFLIFVFLGSIVSATNVLDFGDLMILGMAFPNVIGVVLLSGEVRRDLVIYWQKYTNGEFVEYDKKK